MSLLGALLLDPYRVNVWIAFRSDGVAGAGTLNDPYDGSTASRLETVLNGLPDTPVTVHFGPGTFDINAFADGDTSSWAKPKMRIVGSGIGVTTLKVVGTTASVMNFAIGHPFTTGSAPDLEPNSLDYFEVCDLSIDCNVAAAATGASCGAIRVMGSHTRLRRIKATNWGKKSGGSPQCFVFVVVTADPASGVAGVVDTGIEECIALRSTTGSSGPVTVFHAGPKDSSGNNVEGYGVGAFIRNCYLDSGWPTDTGEVRGLSIGWCKGGLVEGNQLHNTKYGGPMLGQASSRDVVVRNNFYKNVAQGPGWSVGTLDITASTLDRYSSDHTIAVLTTATAHGLQRGERVKVDASSGSSSLYKGIFVVKDVPAPNQLRYQMLGDPGGSAASPTLKKVFGAGKLQIENNTIELATGADGDVGIKIEDASLSPQAPDYAHGELIFRDNRIRYVDGAFDGGYAGTGIQANGVKNLIIRDNVVEAAPTNPIGNNRCGAVTYFNNRTPGGVLIQGVNQGDSNKKYDELETEAEDAMVLALINHH